MDEDPQQSTASPVPISSQHSHRRTPPLPASSLSRRDEAMRHPGRSPYQHEEPPHFYFRTHSHDHRHHSPPIYSSRRDYIDEYPPHVQRPRTSDSFRATDYGRRSLGELGHSHRYSGHDDFRSRTAVSPRRQTMDSRDYSPGRTPRVRQFHERSDHTYREYPEDRRRDGPRYGRHSPDPTLPPFRSDFESGYTSPRHPRHLDDNPHSRPNRYPPPRQEPFSFAHRPSAYETEDSRRRELPRLPPAREILSSPGVLTPTRSPPGNNYVDPLERARSSGDRLRDDLQGSYNDYGRGPSPQRRPSIPRPEEILASMSRQRSLPDENPNPPGSPSVFAYPEADRHNQPRRADFPHTPRPHTGVTSTHRSGFPSSGLRATAPATPPGLRYVPSNYF